MTALLIIAAVALQRLGEVAWAQCNTKRLLARGAVEVGREHYLAIVLMHVSWLASMLVFVPRPLHIHVLPLVLFLLTEVARVWVLASLGPFFTTRIITLPGASLVRTGPYRFVRHPNYLVVAGEIFLLPLVLGEPAVALVFTLANTAVLSWRIRVENAALAPRRSPALSGPSFRS